MVIINDGDKKLRMQSIQTQREARKSGTMPKGEREERRGRRREGSGERETVFANS